jgi:type IV pilus assembly protein PilP
MKQLNLRWKRFALAILLALPFGVIACEDEAPPAPPSAPAQPGAEAGADPQAAKSAAAGPSDLPPLPVADFAERDFQESPANRDPFKNFTEQIDAPLPSETSSDKQEVLVGKYALEELKIVGIVTGTVARVLVQDPTGLGWVLRVGDFVGREEGVRGGQGTTVPVHWRLDRIRQNDVVFIRESPDPSTPATTRVISMRSPEELKQEIRTGIRGTRPDEAPPASSAGASKG